MLKRQPPGCPSSDCVGIVRFRTRRRRAGILLLVVLATGQGCYSYHTTQLPDIQLGEEVRLVLEDRGYRRVAPGAAQEAAPMLEGRLAGVTNDSLTLSVWIGEAYRGTPFESAYQDIAIPLIDVQRVEHREFSRKRTALVAAGVVAVIFVLIEGIGLVNFLGNGGEDDEPDPPLPVGIGGAP